MLKDSIPTLSKSGNYHISDLKIIDFELLKVFNGINRYFVPVYILTDRVISFNEDVYETMVRVGYSGNCEFLNIQEQCLSKLEAYKQHKIIYKKVIKGYFDNEIISIVEKRLK